MIELKHHQVKQNPYCLVGCLLMALDYLGFDELTENDVAEMVEMDPVKGVAWQYMPALLEKALPVEVRQGKAREGLLPAILADQLPVIMAVTVKYKGGRKNHATVLVGIENDTAYLHDPLWPEPITLPYQMLMENWLWTGGQRIAVIERRPELDFVQFFYNTDGNPEDCYSLAPERQTNFGRIEPVSGILLSGDNRDDAQIEANTLSGLYRAWKNIRFPHIRIQTFNNRFLEPATLDYFAVELDPGDTVRGYDWNRKEFLCTEVEYEIDHENGIILATITGEASTWGPDGVAGPYPSILPPSNPPDEPPEYWGDWGNIGGPGGDPPPWVVTTVYLAFSNCHIVRATGVIQDPANPVYTDLGAVPSVGSLYWFANDKFDPHNTAMAATRDGVYKTTNLSADTPTWTQVLDLSADIDDYACMVVSSPMQQDLWMVAAMTDDGHAGSEEPIVYWTPDGGDNWTLVTGLMFAGNDTSTGWAKIEVSSHNADNVWVTFYDIDHGDNVPCYSYTDDMWTTVTGTVALVGSSVLSTAPCSLHRRHSNADDLWQMYGYIQDDVAPDEARVYVNYADGGSTTNALETGNGVANILWVGYTGGLYWTLAVGDGGYNLHTSPGAGAGAWTWTLRYAFPNTMVHMDTSGQWLFAAQNLATCPMLVSSDLGMTWQSAVGNWDSIGYNFVRCCAVV